MEPQTPPPASAPTPPPSPASPPDPATPPVTPPATPPASAPPPAAPAEKIETGADDPDIQNILKDLGKMVTPNPAPAPPPAAEPPAPPPASAAAAPATAPEPVKVKKSKPISEQVEGAVRKVLGEQQAAPPAAPPAPAPAPTPPAATQPDANEQFDAGLPEEDRQTMETAKFAEKKFNRPGLADEFRGFLRKVKSYQDKVLTEDPARTLDDNDEEYVKFINDNKPQISSAEWRKFEREHIVSTATSESQKKFEETKAELDKTRREVDEIKVKQREIDFRPELTRALNDVESDLKSMIDTGGDSPLTPIAKTMAEKGVDAALKEDPELAPILVQAAEMAMGNAAEFMALTSGVRDYDPKNTHHVWLARFVDAQCDLQVKNGTDLKRTEDGVEKTFMPRGEFVALQRKDPAAASKHWTFSNQEICKRIARNAQKFADETARSRLAQLTAAGFVRNKSSTAPPVAQPPNPRPSEPPSPMAQITAAPGQGSGAVNTAETPMSKEELTALGLSVLAK